MQPDSPTAGEAASALIDDYLAEPGNADLNAFNWGNTNPDLLTGDSGTYTSGGSPADILAAMMSTLVTDNPTITTEQEGRARAIIQTALASMNSDSGGSGAVMFSQYTNIPSTSGVKAQGVITSDNLVNATRTGNNATYYIDINSLVNGGTFVLQTTNNRNNGAYSGTVTVDGPGGNTSGPLTVAQIQTTLNSIKAAIAAGPVGTNWPTGNSGNAGPVAVRYVSYSQLADLRGDAVANRARGRHQGLCLRGHLPGRGAGNAHGTDHRQFRADRARHAGYCRLAVESRGRDLDPGGLRPEIESRHAAHGNRPVGPAIERELYERR